MKKKIIIILIFTIGLCLLFYGIFNYKSKSIKFREDEINTSSLDNKEYIPITNKSNKIIDKELNILDFLTSKTDYNTLIISFGLLNNTNEIINNKLLLLNVYNDNTMIGTFEYEIVEMNLNDEIKIKTEIDIQNEKITKYEFIIDEYKTEINSK